MESQPTIVTDPLQRKVYIPSGVCRVGAQAPSAGDLYDTYGKVVETPACMIETDDAHVHYFRSIDWNVTVLIETALVEERWTAVDCRKNPDSTYIGSLLRRGKFISGESLN